MREATTSTRSFGDSVLASARRNQAAWTAISVGAGVVAIAAKRMFDEWDAGADALRTGTGATGAALGEFEDSMVSVAGTVTQGVGSVGQAMADLARRTGQTGEPLEALTRSFLDLERITGEAASTTIPVVTRLFGDWSIATEDQVASTDKLFLASQNTGVGVGRLAELMVSFGSPLRQLGFDFDNTAAMFAKFEQEGVNIQTALPGLRMALKNFAADGREPAQALQETIDAIRNAATTAEANTLAFETFGVRAGPDLAAAIREGRFEFGDLIEAMNSGGDSIQAAADDTLDLSDKLAMFRNRVVAALGPFGEMGALVAGAIGSIGPLVFGLGTLTTALNGSALAASRFGLAMKALPGLVPLAAVAAGVGILATRASDLNDGVVTLNESLDRIASGEELNAAVRAWAESINEGNATIDEAIVAFEGLEDAAARAPHAFGGAEVSAAELEAQLRSLLDMGSERGPAFAAAWTQIGESVSAGLTDVGNSASSAARALEALRSAQLALVDPIFAVVSAVQADTAAEDELRAARRQLHEMTQAGRRGTDEYAEAQRAVEEASFTAAQAHAGLIGAVASLTEAVEEGRVRQRDAEAALRDMASAAGLTKSETEALVDKLHEGVDALQLWNRTSFEDKTATVTTHHVSTGGLTGGLTRHAGGRVDASGPRRFHAGGKLRSDERIVIGQTGERILSRPETRMYEGLMRSLQHASPGPGLAPPIINNNYYFSINAGAYVHERELGKYLAQKLIEHERHGGRHHPR